LLCIADVAILIRPQGGCLLADYDDESYRPFLVSRYVNREPVDRIEVRVATGILPDSNNLIALFESGEAWSIFSGGQGCVMAFWRGTGSDRERYLVADANRLTTEVLVHCLPLITERSDQIPKMLNPVRYPLDQLLLMNHLAPRGGVILHSAGVVRDGAGMAFAGASRAGKSTLTRLFQEHAPGVRLLSDDRVIMRRKDGIFWMYGTPWPGEAGIAANESADLHALFFLTKASRNHIRSLSPAQAARRLFPVVSCPWYDRERLPGVLDTCERLVTSVPCFELQFTPTPEMVSMFEDFVMRELAV
jgi:hypothetical protein